MEQPQISLQPFEVEACAHAAHEANRAFAATLGDHSHQSWEATHPEKKRAVKLYVLAIANGEAWSPAKQHQLWMDDRLADGWRLGPTKDEANKIHPCLVPYDQLPPEQAIKDDMFITVVKAVMNALWRLPK
jgi:hypothetical protein